MFESLSWKYPGISALYEAAGEAAPEPEAVICAHSA